jgi:hypothetical protein
MRSLRLLLSCLVLSAGCGGGGDAPIDLAIEPPTLIANGSVVLRGVASVPSGSSCPQSSDLVRFGTLGPHDISFRNMATGRTGPVFADLWVCSSEDGRVMRWTSNPISLQAGDNTVVITISTQGRSASASIVVRG